MGSRNLIIGTRKEKDFFTRFAIKAWFATTVAIRNDQENKLLGIDQE